MTDKCWMTMAEAEQAMGAFGPLLKGLIADGALRVLSGRGGEWLLSSAAVARCRDDQYREARRAIVAMTAGKQKFGLH